MFDIATLQRHIPASLKNALKPYYRTVFPNKLHVLFWVTFRCNYRCSYCPVVTKFDYTSLFPRSDERTVDEWLGAFSKLPPAMFYVSGGEPFMYRGLPQLINRLDAKHTVLGVVTNGSVDMKVYREVEKPLHLNISFHNEFVSDDELLAKLEQLKEHFHLNVNIVATPANLPMIERVGERLRGRRVSLHVDPYVDPGFTYTPEQKRLLLKYLPPDRRYHLENQLNSSDYAAKSCSAGKNYINVLPNGDVFTCIGGADYLMSPLVRDIVRRGKVEARGLDIYRMGNLFDDSFQLRDEFMECRLPCKSACDFDSAIIKPL